ncbi:MAG: hypothetical protein ACLFUT_11460 [Desulfobacteraceae bacterium]
MTYTATGAVTNVAARLADHARGGDILIGEETQRLIQGNWKVYDRGRHQFKGMDRPLQVYSLTKAGGLEGIHKKNDQGVI